MFQIKVQNKGFSFQLDFSGSIAQTLEKMPTEIREEFTGNIEDLLKAFCCIISGTILAPITAFNFFPRAFEAMRNLAMGSQEEIRKAKNDEIELFTNDKVSSADH
ncbi:hypothetical protein KJ684_00550 [Patescibacteria group bacterium]|nr:hypothetical protein [Patescibacteria group bacterium]